MFGLGFAEILAICLVALIVVRPKDLPQLLRKLGRIYREASRQLKAARRIVEGMDAEEKKGNGHTEGDGT